MEREISPQELATGMEMLRRGGKILLKSGPQHTTVELKLDGTLEVVPARK
jgi:hypothetical protein